MDKREVSVLKTAATDLADISFFIVSKGKVIPIGFYSYSNRYLPKPNRTKALYEFQPPHFGLK